jgi:hypothetical protein
MYTGIQGILAGACAAKVGWYKSHLRLVVSRALAHDNKLVGTEREA